MISQLAHCDLRTKYGVFQEALFSDGPKEVIALYMGELNEAENVLCRLHSSCIFGHYFNSAECSCQEEMIRSQQLIQKAGKGIIILLDQEGKGNGHLALMKSVPFKRQGMKQADAYVAAGYKKDNRDYSNAIEILKFFNIGSICLLTENTSKVEMMRNAGIEVSSTKSLGL